MNIKAIDVYLNTNTKRKVGILAYKDKKIYFEYEKEFLATGIEISPYKLPLKSGIITCKDTIFDGLWGVFNDSLPDGWGKLLMDRHFRNININPILVTQLDRLNYIGNFGMGALIYEPQYELRNSKDENIILDDLALTSQNILKGSSDIVDELLLLNGSSAGARPKAMIQLDEKQKNIIHGASTLKDGFSHWLVKFNSSSDLEEAGKIEYIYSLLAKDAGIYMPQTTLLKGAKNSYFAIKRFDRIKDKRVHIHSLSGLIHSDFRYPSLDYDDILALTLHLTKDIKEQLKVFKLACFNLFVHNRDDHAKNFSYLLDENNNWKFAPAYDITFSNGPGGEHSTMYAGEGENPTIKHLLELAKKHNIKDANIIIEAIKNSILKFESFAKDIELSNKVSKNITNTIHNKC